MKKVLGLVAAAAFVFSFSSCKKAYTCECCYTSTYTGKTCASATSGKIKKKDAEAWCTGTGASGYTCSLK